MMIRRNLDSGRSGDVMGHARHYRPGPVTRSLAALRQAEWGRGDPVVTGRKIGLQASGGNESANHFLGAGVVTRC